MLGYHLHKTWEIYSYITYIYIIHTHTTLESNFSALIWKSEAISWLTVNVCRLAGCKIWKGWEIGQWSFGGDSEARDSLEAGGLCSSPRTNLNGRPWKDWPDQSKWGQTSVAGEVKSQKSGLRKVGSSMPFSLVFLPLCCSRTNKPHFWLTWITNSKYHS